MIPSRNEGIEERARKKNEQLKALQQEWKACPEEFFKKRNMAPTKDMPHELCVAPHVSVVCDCCGKVYDNWFATYDILPWDYDQRHYADRREGFVRVLDKIYFGCRAECATALFTIHHQYAMREQEKPRPQTLHEKFGL